MTALPSGPADSSYGQTEMLFCKNGQIDALQI